MRSKPHRFPAAFVVAAACAALAPALAQAVPAGSQQATGGTVTVTLSWKASAGRYGGVRSPRLRIDRAGATALDVGIGDVCDACFFPGDAESPNVAVADLDGDGEPEVLVTTFTGGAHCCTDVGIWDYRSALGTYGHLVRNFGNSSYDLDDLDGDGGLELVSADDRFSYAFAAYVFSVRPPQILRWRRAPTVGLVDVTRQFPAVIRDHARATRRNLRGHAKDLDLRGPLAAYVADMYLLGRGKEGLAEIARAQRRGRLGSAKDDIWPGGRRYRPALLKFLRTAGYR